MSETDLRAFYTRYIETLNAHDFASIREFLSDDLTYFGDAVTADLIVSALTDLGNTVPDLHWEIQELSVNGDHLAARLLNTGTPAKEWLGVAPSGASFEIVEFAVYHIRDGRFVHMTNVHDAEALRRQLAA
ncbi:ester cyclase [Streptomyces millisiae]|uniref:Ester cyclase n=1 Tax=Streptomyces millisiae TaxID=3075542 RepID=A0ABU2LYL0_9ACTN|nr:ester cyclase [Streptomyces sp. DSM 44918]MDT0322368.1 ester cyclase [Streptomyces sp. DSM 44918]